MSDSAIEKRQSDGESPFSLGLDSSDLGSGTEDNKIDSSLLNKSEEPEDEEDDAQTISEEVESTADLSEQRSQNNASITETTGSISRKRKLLKKAPNAPKRFKSAYICFVTEKMDDVKKSLPSDIKITELMKTLAYMWKNLPPLERAEFEKKAAADKSRYFEEMSSYTGPLQVPNKRQKKPEGAPKRAMSAFLSYSQMMRPQMKAMYPTMKNNDISTLLADRWHHAMEEEKRPHIEREMRDREKYYEEMAVWKEEESKRKELEREHQHQREEQERLQFQQQRQQARNMIDFLDLPSSNMIWESFENGSDTFSDDKGGNGSMRSNTEKELKNFWDNTGEYSSPSYPNDRKQTQKTTPKSQQRPSGSLSVEPLPQKSSRSQRNSSSSTSSGHKNRHSENPSINSSSNGGMSTLSNSSNNNSNTTEDNNNTSRKASLLSLATNVPSSSGATSNDNNTNSSSNNNSNSNATSGYLDHRYYPSMMPFSFPEGQYPYPAFPFYSTDYSHPTAGYFNTGNINHTNHNNDRPNNASSNSNPSNPYPHPMRYPYSMFPQMYTRLPGSEKDGSNSNLNLYPGYPPAFPGYANYPPLEAPPGGGEGYWQWRPTTSTTDDNKTNNSSNNTSASSSNNQNRLPHPVSPFFPTYPYGMTYFPRPPPFTSTNSNHSQFITLPTRESPPPLPIHETEINEQVQSVRPSGASSSKEKSTTTINHKRNKKNDPVEKRSQRNQKSSTKGGQPSSSTSFHNPIPAAVSVPSTSSNQYNPLNNVVETLRAIQHAGLSGQEEMM